MEKGIRCASPVMRRMTPPAYPTYVGEGYVQNAYPTYFGE